MSQILRPEVIVRRCRTCGSRATGRSCGECGSSLAPRQKIGVLHGVGQNFGTVNNVFNIVPSEPEVVDFRDVQDGLNAMFPERVLLPSTTASSALGPSKAVQAANRITRVLFGILVVFCALVLAMAYWA